MGGAAEEPGSCDLSKGSIEMSEIKKGGEERENGTEKEKLDSNKLKSDDHFEVVIESRSL